MIGTIHGKMRVQWWCNTISMQAMNYILVSIFSTSGVRVCDRQPVWQVGVVETWNGENFEGRKTPTHPKKKMKNNRLLSYT